MGNGGSVHSDDDQAYQAKLLESKMLRKKAEEDAVLTNSQNRFLEFALKHNARIKAQKEEV